MVVRSMDAGTKSTEAISQPFPNKQTSNQIGHKGANEINDETNTRDKTSLSEKTIINAIGKANKAIVGSNRSLEFSIHERTKEIMVKVIDTETNEVVREIPSEKILDMVASMLEMAGILVDERR